MAYDHHIISPLVQFSPRLVRNRHVPQSLPAFECEGWKDEDFLVDVDKWRHSLRFPPEASETSEYGRQWQNSESGRIREKELSWRRGEGRTSVVVGQRYWGERREQGREMMNMVSDKHFFNSSAATKWRDTARSAIDSVTTRVRVATI